MKNILAAAKWFLMALGALALGGLLVAVALFYRGGRGGGAAGTSPKDVVFVLNWCGLGGGRLEKIENSYVSERSFTGDYTDAYGLRVSSVAIAELAPPKSDLDGGWHRGDRLEGVVKDEASFVSDMAAAHGLSWFPSPAEISSKAVYVYPWSGSYQGTRVSGVELIFVRPADRMVFFLGAKI